MRRFFLIVLIIVIIIPFMSCIKKSNIVGLWRLEDTQELVEFTTNHQIFNQGEGLGGTYEILEKGSLEISLQDDNEEKFIWSNVSITDNSATFEYGGMLFTMKKVGGYPNLENDILGRWLDEENEGLTFDFLENGNLFVLDSYDNSGEYGSYSIISDNTLLINFDDETFHIFIINLSEKQLEIGAWDEIYTIKYIRGE
jgi:hypothetical protein